uniref:Uncharacterized protein n=1 Tax=Vespula pensylvanica TaxID=30213 RepID=A0A834U439_VESPE|nr:hypothetical protein H0235_012241 [Vespula pensylvanica]
MGKVRDQNSHDSHDVVLNNVTFKRSSEVEVFLGNDELAFTQHIVALDIPLYESWHEVLRAFEDTTTRMSGRAPLAIWRICSVEVEERLDSRYADGEIYILKCECL